MLLRKILFLICLFSFVEIFAQTFPPAIGERENLGLVENDAIDEASGIAASTKNPGVIWTHNDSGDENRIFAFDTTGKNLGEYFLSGVENRDWEDIAVGPGPEASKSYIYIGDIGDNDAQFSLKYIYRFEEPSVSLNQNPIISNISNVEKITFYYQDDPRDAETLMLDPLSNDLYIVSKRNSKVRFYRLPFPQSTTSNIEAEISAEIKLEFDPENEKPFNYLTAGDISPNGTEILLKSYTNIFYWYRYPSKTIAETVSSSQPEILPFENSFDETQCEAICWKPFADMGYYTLSEEKIDYNGTTLNFPASLYYYKRTSEVTRINDLKISNSFSLEQNFPNPFNPTTKIKYALQPKTVISNEVRNLRDFSSQTPRNDNIKISLKVYDFLGSELQTLVNEHKTPGNYEIEFDGSKLSSGIYYYELTYGNFRKVKKMVLLK
ncbi:MAG: T9SS type A sorting domain-containing protein [Ignavibacteriae bacterium]|nr:T9SS type A sorting domain-containing protein [Ignavibacteriota bacterium]